MPTNPAHQQHSNNTSIPDYLICKAEKAISQFSIQVPVKQCKCRSMEAYLESLIWQVALKHVQHLQRRGTVICNRCVPFELGYEQFSIDSLSKAHELSIHSLQTDKRLLGHDAEPTRISVVHAKKYQRAVLVSGAHRKPK